MYLNVCACCLCVHMQYVWIIQWKHVHILWRADQCICMYKSVRLSLCRCLSVCSFIAAHLHVWSQVFPGLVLRLRGGEVILQEALQVLKGGPLIGLPLRINCIHFGIPQHFLFQGHHQVKHSVCPELWLMNKNEHRKCTRLVRELKGYHASHDFLNIAVLTPASDLCWMS